MSSSQKKGKEYSWLSEHARGIKGQYLRVSSRLKTRLGSRTPSPARTSNNALTAKDQRPGGEQPATPNFPIDVASKSAVVASEQPVATSEPPNSAPESLVAGPVTDIREKTRKLVLKRLGKEVINEMDPKVAITAVREDLSEYNKHNPRQQTVGRMLKRINEYLYIVDVAIQHHPDITSLVWAGIRTVFRVALNHYETLENLEQAIDIITTTLTKCDFYQGVFDAFVRQMAGSALVRHEVFNTFNTTLPELYADVFEVAFKTEGYFNPGSRITAVKNSLKPFCIEYKPVLDGISQKEAVLRELVEDATIAQILETSGDLRDVKEAVSRWGTSLEDTLNRLGKIEARISQLIDANESETLIKCRTWLNPLQNPDVELDSNLTNRTPDTCIWILRTEEFNSIIEGEEREHLWIYGQPGAGKSVLSSFMVATVRGSSSRKRKVLHFFCKDGSPATSTAAAIIANLIDQLVADSELKALFTVLNTARQKNARSTHCTDFATLWAIFLDMVRQFPLKIIVFVDALDECTTHRSEFLNALLLLPADVENIRFCVTSRNYADINKAFTEHSDGKHIRSVEMTPADDITKYLQVSIAKHEELHRHADVILEKVPRHGNGMFRYAVLMIGELLSEFCVNIAEKLESPPASLNEMYERILLRLDSDPPRNSPKDRKQRKKIFEWVTMAKYPLSVEALAWVSSLDPDFVRENFDPSPVKYKIQPNSLLEICGPLLEIVDGRVHFTHLSAKEFLLSKADDLHTRDANQRDRIAGYLVDPTRANVSIALTGVALSRHSQKFRSSDNEIGSSQPFYYPVVNWILHAEDVANTGFQSESDRKLSQMLWDAVSQALTDYSVWQPWILSFPYYAGGHEDRCLFKFRGHEWTNSSSPTALGIASSYGLRDVLQQLLSSGVDTSTIERGALDVNVVDNLNMSPLSWAVLRGNSDVVRLLVDRGADIETRCNSGRTPLSWAARNGQVDVVRLLLDRGAGMETQEKEYGQSPLSWAARNGQVDVVRLLLDRGAGIETQEREYGQSPLSWAAEMGKVDVVRLLLDRGADIETRSNSGQTPLSWAALRGDVDVVRLLLDRGADIKTRSNNGRTPLSWAAQRGNVEAVRLLLDRGAAIETQDREYGQSPLSWAAKNGQVDVVRLLLDRGADIMTCAIDNRTPLSWAAQWGNVDVVRLLLDRGAGIETRDRRWGQSPLSWAAERGDVDVVRLLLDRGADIETRSNSGQTPLSWAAKSGQVDVVRLLLDRGADIETCENAGHTLLSWAETSGNTKMQELLSRG